MNNLPGSRSHFGLIQAHCQAASSSGFSTKPGLTGSSRGWIGFHFIIWPAAALACDYAASCLDGAGHLSLGLGSVLPPSSVSPFLSIPEQTFLPDSFVCRDPGCRGNQLALRERLIPHLNIPSYLW